MGTQDAYMWQIKFYIFFMVCRTDYESGYIHSHNIFYMYTFEFIDVIGNVEHNQHVIFLCVYFNYAQYSVV